MAGPGICILCLADTCTSEVYPVFNPVAPYGYLLSYLLVSVVTAPPPVGCVVLSRYDDLFLHIPAP